MTLSFSDQHRRICGQFRAVAVALVAMAAVTACQNAEPSGEQSPAINSPSVTSTPVPVPVPKSAPAATEPVPPPQSAAQQPAKPDPTVTEIFPDPDTITGLDRQALTDILGKPGFTRRDEPAEIWQYRAGICTLDVFLYRDEAGPAYRVTHFESRTHGTEPLTTKDCFVNLLKMAADKQAG